MDPFTQRMLERARARQEKIDQKLANSGQTPKRKPLAENVGVVKPQSPVKSPIKATKEPVFSPKKPSRESLKSETQRKSAQKSDLIIASPQKRNDVIVTKKEFKSPKKGSLNRRNSDVSVEINISHRNDIQIEVQVEERDVPISILYDPNLERGSNVVIKEIQDETSKPILDKEASDMGDSKNDRPALRHNIKSRLDRLGNLYSDTPNLSSPINRTESNFNSASPPHVSQPKERPAQEGKKKFGRLAALADQINNWEDDLSHHNHTTKPFNSRTFTKSVNECQRLESQIVADLEGEGYRRVSATQSRLVYDFTTPEIADRGRQEPKRAQTTPSVAAAPDMATMVAGSPPPNPANPTTVTKKPSIKKYRAPTPPRKIPVDENSDSDKDKENNVLPQEENENDVPDCCVQTKTDSDKPAPEKGSPLVKKFATRLNGNVDRSSVLSKAAMFEAGSPKAKEKDPAEMSLRERKALFEKNKGSAIIPKAPFGLAPSVKTLQGENKADKARPAPNTKQDKSDTISVHSTSSKTNLSNNSRTNSKDSVNEDTVSQSSLGGGIKGKLAALFNKEQTISETTIANKFKQEREKEMEMLQNRFHYKPKQENAEQHNDSDDDHSENDPSEKAPLMGSTMSLSQAKKPEIVSNLPKVTFDDKEEPTDKDDKVVASQPVKRRSSQDSQVVLSVLEDVKRIKVNNAKETNGALPQPSIYPHLSDIETDQSNSQEEYSDCGGSSADTCRDNLNKSDNWAETSFGREVMNVVKKNNNSYKKAVREDDSDSSHSPYDSELDEMLDEALEDSEGPTPPKINKQQGLSSNSFVYEEKAKFKSPVKVPPTTPARHDRGAELVHSVSFYRRMQNASSTPSTPLRVVRHESPEREVPAPDEPVINVTTVRERIKELQNEINKQQTIISQASQALNLCASTIEFSGSTEQAEGERLLLLATHRRQACVHEVQRLQVEGAGPARCKGMASLHLRDINVPLRRDYIRHLNADYMVLNTKDNVDVSNNISCTNGPRSVKYHDLTEDRPQVEVIPHGAVGHHAVCLLKCRDRVVASSMQLTSPSTSLLHFPDEIRMEGLASDFKVTVEIYLLQATKEILPHDVKYHISNKKGNSKLLTPKSKVSELKAVRVQSPAGPHAVRSPQFTLHGYCIFALQQASRKTFTLNKVPCGSPLEGSLNVEIRAKLRVSAPAPHSAFLTAFDDVSGLGAWHRRWFKLTSPRLQYWKYPDDANRKMPIGDIDLATVVSDRVIRAPRDLCARPNTLLLETSVPVGLACPESGSLIYFRRPDGQIVRRHLLAADTPKDRDDWLDCLNKALEYVRCCATDDD
ncbi:Actin-binding protein anillin [Papilio machaon]|uniref:Actin-binding protein anillin n=1 Tax=Papilio machaon TaxID=76193 RepID=A0A0N1IQA5_PAPMA|nr:Actin-binding protein anillin [Papilio machaon]